MSSIESLHPLEIKVLKCFTDPTEALAENELSRRSGLPPENVRTAVQWLLAKELLETAETTIVREVRLGGLGEEYLQRGIPERLILELTAAEPLPTAMLAERTGFPPQVMGTAVGNLKKAGLITFEDGKVKPVEGAAEKRAELEREWKVLEELLRRVAEAGGGVALDELEPGQRAAAEKNARKRGKARSVFSLAERQICSYRLKDPSVASRVAELGDEDEISVLTPELLKNGGWRGRRFRRYNLSIRPQRLMGGRKHAYRMFLDRLKTKLLSMGFVEMRGSLVENEFWNMDALFMPQFHSARDIHDVYFIESPTHAVEIEEPFLERVAQTHENGSDTGSKGWGYRFDINRARRLILRSQGTCLSARRLASRPEVPGKYFAIARCFRYDKVDATHLADFYQVEGIVIDEKINFRHLLGLLRLFAREIADADEIAFKPAYFPFTEPSVELHARHPQIGWMELGGAGMFRPEVTRPLGVEQPVIAWGLGVDRMAMVSLGLDDIRELFSRDLEFVRNMR